MTYWQNRYKQLRAPQPDRDAPAAYKPQTIASRQTPNMPTAVGANPPSLETMLGGWGTNLAKTLQKPLDWAPPTTQPPQGHPKDEPRPQPVTPPPAPTPPAMVVPAQATDWIPNVLNPAGQATKAALDNMLSQSLAAYGAQETEAKALSDLIFSRLAKDQIEVEDEVNQNLAGRGIYSSGIRKTDLENVQGDFNRHREDEASRVLQQLYGIGQGKGSAQQKYVEGILQAIRDEANLLAQLGIAPADQPEPPPQTYTPPPQIAPVTGGVSPGTSTPGTTIPRDPGYNALPSAVQNLLGSDTLGLEDFEQTVSPTTRKKKRRPMGGFTGTFGGWGG